MTLSVIQQPDSHSVVEGVSTLYNISWEQFKAIDAALEEQKGVKLSYLNGLLEIMSPIGPEHESVKSTLGLLLEAYWREKGTRFYRCGGFTIESPETASGTPDESYAIGSSKEIPDIVIEVIVTSGRLDKKELYRPKQVPEVWFWRKEKIIVFGLGEQGYEQQQRSRFLPDLDLAVLERYLSYADQYDAVTDLIKAVQQGEV
jgi:Uma2 family endonuclease